MDRWKYFDITHREHVFCNPMSVQKFEQLIALLRLKPGAKVLAIATGKGEFIIRLAERYQIEGIGIDLSPYCVSDAQQKHKIKRLPRNLRVMRDYNYLQNDIVGFGSHLF